MNPIFNYDNDFWGKSKRKPEKSWGSGYSHSLLQRIFSIPTDTLLIVFLKYSQELRDFCGFDVVPNGSKYARLK